MTTIDFSRLPDTGEKGVRTVRIITHVVRSLIGVSGVERVGFRSAGHPWGLPLMHGGVLDRPYDYRSLQGWTLVFR